MRAPGAYALLGLAWARVLLPMLAGPLTRGVPVSRRQLARAEAVVWWQLTWLACGWFLWAGSGALTLLLLLQLGRPELRWLAIPVAILAGTAVAVPAVVPLLRPAALARELGVGGPPLPTVSVRPPTPASPRPAPPASLERSVNARPPPPSRPPSASRPEVAAPSICVPRGRWSSLGGGWPREGRHGAG